MKVRKLVEMFKKLLKKWVHLTGLMERKEQQNRIEIRIHGDMLIEDYYVEKFLKKINEIAQEVRA